MFKQMIIVIALAALLIGAGCTQGGIPNTPNTPITNSSIFVPSSAPKVTTVVVPYDANAFLPTNFDPSRAIRTQGFANMDDLYQFAKHFSTAQSGYYGGYYGGGIVYARDAMMEKTVASGVASSSATGAPVPTIAPAPAATPTQDTTSNGATDYSHTNNQVESVDEADLLKTDGNYIYTITDNVLYIVKAYPGENASVVSTIRLEGQIGNDIMPPIVCSFVGRCMPPIYQSGYQPQELFVSGNKLAVFGNYQNSEFFANTGFSPRYGMSFYNIYDISDRANPRLEKEYKFEGNYFRARMIGSEVYFITTSQLYARDNPIPLAYDGTTKLASNVADVYYYNVPYNNPMYVNIHAIDMNSTSVEPSSKSIVVENSQELYMSENNLYFTYTNTINEWELQQQIAFELMQKNVNISKSDLELIRKINATDELVLSPYEKSQRIMSIYSQYAQMLSSNKQQDMADEAKTLLKQKLQNYSHLEFTVINKVAVSGANITPVANAQVPGHVNNQFSMDEYNGNLRIATTLSARWSWWGQDGGSEIDKQSSNNIYTLDSNLNQLDSLEGIAVNEQIYSTRFVGGRLYMVTFRQVDPFFVYDLSDPKNIKEMGQLKIPGFSRYLHPYDENTLIGIGQDTNSNGQTTGLKVSLFDVSDIAHPKEIAKYVSTDRYAQSSALWEHRAFLFSKEKNLLVIPAYNYDWQDKNNNFNGALVFNITKSGIALRGLIDHSQTTDQYYYSPAVERSLYIENELYTKSPHLLRINALSDLHSVKNVELNAGSGSGITKY